MGPAEPDAASTPPLSTAAGRVRSSTIRELLALTDRPRVLSLAGGLPPEDALPTADLAEVAAGVLADPASIQYGPTEGHGPLREHLADDAGCAVDAVLVTHGSQQALDLVVRALVDPGTPVVVEAPTYLGALQALGAAGADVHAVPVDRDGMDLDRLAGMLAGGLRPALCYLAPTFQNPSGVVMSAERRAALAVLADRYGFVVADDDPYRAIGFEPVPDPLRAWVDPDLSVSLGTFSKVAAPSLRVGWAQGPPWLVERLARLKQATDLQTSSLTQRLLTALLDRPGWLAGRSELLTALLRPRAEALAAALAAGLGDRIRFEPARGGMFLWAELPGIDAEALLPRALDAGVAFVPGAAFVPTGAPSSWLRLCYATLDPARLRTAAERLAATVVPAA